jgi:hypothetical protein
VHLQEDVALFEKEGKAALTALCPPLEGIDPDDAFSAVPYEKGFALLYELQTRAGVLPFEAFVKVLIESLDRESHTYCCCLLVRHCIIVIRQSLLLVHKLLRSCMHEHCSGSHCRGNVCIITATVCAHLLFFFF